MESFSDWNNVANLYSEDFWYYLNDYIIKFLCSGDTELKYLKLSNEIQSEEIFR